MLATVAIIKGLVWISLIPAFKVADEPAHYENIQFRGERFKAPYPEAPESLGTTIHNGSPPDVRLVWTRSNELFRNRYVAGVRSVHEEQTLREMARDPASRRGTGRLTSANYLGFYYNAAVPAYLLFKHASVLTRLAAVRCVSLLFGVIAVIATFFTARLVMNSRALALAAAMIVMLQPMESQMTAAVNNDAGVIGLAALLFYLQVRFLVRQPEIPRLGWGVLMAVLVGCILFTKPHGFAMLPGCVFVCALIVARNLRERRVWVFAAITATIAAAVVVAALYEMREHGQTAVMANTPASTAVLPRGAYPSYLTFLSRVDDDFKLYLYRSFFGQFGWLEYSLPGYWLEYIGTVWTVVKFGAIAAIAARVLRLPGHSWLAIPAFVLSICTVLMTVGFILYAEYRFRLIGIVGVIQGRNLLFGLPALAVVAAAAYGALVPARFRTLSATALVTSAAALNAAAILYIFRYYYGT